MPDQTEQTQFFFQKITVAQFVNNFAFCGIRPITILRAARQGAYPAPGEYKPTYGILVCKSLGNQIQDKGEGKNTSLYN
jgi:hypothetical protein